MWVLWILGSVWGLGDDTKTTDKVPAAAGGKAVAVSAKAAEVFPVNQWVPLFDGATLSGWAVTDFAGHGDVHVQKDLPGGPALVVEAGAALSGVTRTNAVPKMDYEVRLEANKLLGSDFFCGLTFPVGASHCSLIVGGWGGSVVGISSIDRNDASSNETTKYRKFENNRWYGIRVRVTQGRLEAWLDEEQIADVDTKGKEIHMRFGEIEESVPFGLATYQTRAAFRNIKVRALPAAASAGK